VAQSRNENEKIKSILKPFMLKQINRNRRKRYKNEKRGDKESFS
jgi:hypothetical protein